MKFVMGQNGKPELIKEPKIAFVDDGPGKPVGINRFIGVKADTGVWQFRR